MSDAEGARPDRPAATGVGGDGTGAGADPVAGRAPEDGPDRADVLAVFASGRLVDTEASVGAIAFDPDDAGRPLGDAREVSGWSVFTGEETDEELADAERVRLPSLRWVLSRDPAVAFVTGGHDGTAGYWVRGEDRPDGLPVWERVRP